MKIYFKNAFKVLHVISHASKLIIISIYVANLIRQVSQLLRAELKELVDVARAIMEPIEPCDEEW